MKIVLGISAFYHDSAAALVIDGKVVAAAQEERFTRIKHTPDFPINAIKYCLASERIDIDQLDAVVFYDKPLLKFERLLETYYAFAPKGLFSFLKAMPVWMKDKLFLKKRIYDGLKEVGSYNKKRLTLLFSEHHLSHAASTFYPTNYEEAAILTIDGVGEWCTASIGLGRGNKIKILREMNFPHSVGLLYSAFTYFLGFTVNSGEYKLMGLAPYGNPQSIQVNEFIRIIKEHLVDIKEDGSIWLDQRYFDYSTGLRMIKEKSWQNLFGIPRRKPESVIKQAHCDLAMAIQDVIEEIVIKMAREAKKLTGSDILCMAGGVALNCVANGKIEKTGLFKEIFITPASGDAGGALGAALAISHLYFDEPRYYSEQQDNLSGSYLGPDFSDKEVNLMCKKIGAVYHSYKDNGDLTKYAAQRISEGKVVGWFQGRMEFGPRALGHRSILADPRNSDMQKKLNLKIKHREGFRPFAPSVLASDSRDYFDMNSDSPYMLKVSPVLPEWRKTLPADFKDLDMWQKLEVKRSVFQAITHIDFSSRVQTVHQDTNPLFFMLITEFKALTGAGLLANTSLNVRGEPMACTPMDAYRCFMSTEMDVLVINDYIFEKMEQPTTEKIEKWKNDHTLD